MQNGSLAVSDVQAFSSRVLVSGVQRAHSSWSIQRELTGDLPEQVVAVSGIRQASGTISWLEGPEATDRSPNPWNNGGQWLPASGEQVIIYVSDGVTEWPQFVGVIAETTGQVGEPFESTIVDYIDYLNRPVGHSTVLRVHAPRSEGANYIGVGMASGYPLDRALRACNFYATPRMESNCQWSVPAQTSMWPEYGTITAGGSFSGGYSHARTWSAPWGWAMSNFNCTYNPMSFVPIIPSDPVQMTAMASATHAGLMTMTASYATLQVTLEITAARVAIARRNGVEVCRVTMEADATIVTLLVKTPNWTLKTNKGATGTGSSTLTGTTAISSITLTGEDAARCAGFQISKPSVAQEFASLGHVPSYFQDTGAFTGQMDVLRSYVNRPAVDLITEISQATLSAMWFNEFGAFQYIGSDVLRSRAPVQTVTTLNDITALSWQDSRLRLRSQVSVKYLLPAIDVSRYSNINLWSGTGETMESDQTKNLFAETPADEDWAEVDHFTVGAAEGMTAFNQGRGTWIDGYLEDSAGGWTAATGYYTAYPISKIDERTRIFKVVTGTLPAGKKFVLATPDDASNYFPRFRGMSYPILRGRARVKWSETTKTSAIVGPFGSPALEHDAGPWVSLEEGNTLFVDRIADFIAGQVTKPAPVITGLGVTYDPRRQLGDVITISSPGLMGVTLTALIVGVRNSAGPSFRQELDVRVISASSTYTTYAQFEAAYSDSLTYEQWRLLFPDTATYNTFNSDPLRGA